MKRRKMLSVILLLIMVLVISSVAHSQRSLLILVNGKPLQSDVPPQVANGRVLVPLRAVSDALNCRVAWDQGTNIVTIEKAQAADPLRWPYVRKTYNYWEKQITPPPLDGPKALEQTISAALQMLKDNAPQEYRAVCAFITSLDAVPSLQDAVTALMYTDGTCLINLEAFENAATSMGVHTATFYALVLAHEAAHMQTFVSGIGETITKDDQEIISYLRDLRTAERIGAPQFLVEYTKSQLKRHYNP